MGRAMLCRSIATIFVLLACAPTLPRGGVRPPAGADVAILAAAEAEWRALDGVVGDAWARVVVVDADEETMRSLGYCAARGPVCGRFVSMDDPGYVNALLDAGCTQCVVGSTVLRPDAIWPVGLGVRRPELYVSAYVDPERRCRALAHEALHGLGWSGGAPDHYHERVGVWGTSAASAEGRVRALCGESP